MQGRRAARDRRADARKPANRNRKPANALQARGTSHKHSRAHHTLHSREICARPCQETHMHVLKQYGNDGVRPFAGIRSVFQTSTSPSRVLRTGSAHLGEDTNGVEVGEGLAKALHRRLLRLADPDTGVVELLVRLVLALCV